MRPCMHETLYACIPICKRLVCASCRGVLRQPGPVVRIRSYTGLLISPLTAQPLGNEPPSSREQVGGWEQDPHADCDEEGKRGGREPSLCTNSCVAHMGLLCSFGLPLNCRAIRYTDSFVSTVNGRSLSLSLNQQVSASAAGPERAALTLRMSTRNCALLRSKGSLFSFAGEVSLSFGGTSKSLLAWALIMNISQ